MKLNYYLKKGKKLFMQNDVIKELGTNFIEYAVAGVQIYVCTILWANLLFFPGFIAIYRYRYARYILATTEDITAGSNLFVRLNIMNTIITHIVIKLFTFNRFIIAFFIFYHLIMVSAL